MLPVIIRRKLLSVLIRGVAQSLFIKRSELNIYIFFKLISELCVQSLRVNSSALQGLTLQGLTLQSQARRPLEISIKLFGLAGLKLTTSTVAKNLVSLLR